jgi:hypothetical protein
MLVALAIATSVVVLAPVVGPLAFILFAFDPLVTRLIAGRATAG